MKEKYTRVEKCVDGTVVYTDNKSGTTIFRQTVAGKTYFKREDGKTTFTHRNDDGQTIYRKFNKEMVEEDGK